MNFLSPEMLFGLLIAPLAAFAYWRWFGRGAGENHVLHPDLEVLTRASGSNAWRRHGAAAVYVLALGLGAVALARPQAVIPAPDARAGVMLTIDVSGSMRATDVKPTRIDAAKQAAHNFVERLPNEVKAGLVSFAGYAVLEAPLATAHDEVLEKIMGLERHRGTAIGEGLLESLRSLPLTPDGKIDGPQTVILLSDGRNTTGTAPKDAAQQARKLGVKVHTIGIGTTGSNAAQESPFMGFDESELRGIADATGGRYYAVGSAERLEQVYRELGREIGWRPQRTEITALFAVLTALLLGSSLIWSQVQRRII